MLDDLPAGVRDEFEARLSRVPTSGDTYAALASARGLLIDALSASLLACELDALWWAIDEMCDVWPDRRDEGFALARLAAKEWLALANDEAIEGYLDRWDLVIHEALVAWGPSPLFPRHANPDRFEPPTLRVKEH